MEGDRYGREQIGVVGRALPEGPERQSHEARRLRELRRLRERSSTSNCHMSLAADLGVVDKRCCSQSLAGSRRQGPPRRRRARETSPYNETPWTKSSSFSILPHLRTRVSIPLTTCNPLESAESLCRNYVPAQMLLLQ